MIGNFWNLRMCVTYLWIMMLHKIKILLIVKLSTIALLQPHYAWLLSKLDRLEFDKCHNLIEIFYVHFVSVSMVLRDTNCQKVQRSNIYIFENRLNTIQNIFCVFSSLLSWSIPNEVTYEHMHGIWTRNICG